MHNAQTPKPLSKHDYQKKYNMLFSVSDTNRFCKFRVVHRCISVFVFGLISLIKNIRLDWYEFRAMVLFTWNGKEEEAINKNIQVSAHIFHNLIQILFLDLAEVGLQGIQKHPFSTCSYRNVMWVMSFAFPIFHDGFTFIMDGSLFLFCPFTVKLMDSTDHQHREQHSFQ